MDQLFVELIGKTTLNAPKVITIIVENFSLLEEQARFLKATIALPDVKELPLGTTSKRLIQIGPIQDEIADQIRKAKWALNQYEDLEECICDRIEEDLQDLPKKSIIYFNDISRLQLYGMNNENVQRKLILLVEKLRKKHFLVLLYQNSTPQASCNTLSRDLQYISDSVVRVRTFKEVYMMSIWWETIPTTNRTLIPPKIETRYYTCKIGKFYWSSDLLCFYEKNEVAKNFNPDKDLTSNKMTPDNRPEDKKVKKVIRSCSLEDDSSDDDHEDVKEALLPYTRAKDPEQSRIFYYPDKEDDIDEDDPDNDLNF